MKTAIKVFLILSFILLICNLTFMPRLDPGLLKDLQMEQSKTRRVQHETLRALDSLLEASDKIQAQLKELSEQTLIQDTRTESTVENHQVGQLLQEQEKLSHEVQELQ